MTLATRSWLNSKGKKHQIRFDKFEKGKQKKNTFLELSDLLLEVSLLHASQFDGFDAVAR